MNRDKSEFMPIGNGLCRGTFYPTPKKYIGKIVHVPRVQDRDSMICVKSGDDYVYIYIYEIQDIRSVE